MKRDYEQDWQAVCLVDGMTGREMEMRGMLRYWMFNYKQSQSQLQVAQEQIEELKKELSLTTFNDLRAENAALRADCAEIIETLQSIKLIMDESEGIVGWHKNGDISPWDEGLFQDVVKSLARPHPGASLLKELEALRTVQSAAERLHTAMIKAAESTLSTNYTYRLSCNKELESSERGLIDALAAVKESD